VSHYVDITLKITDKQALARALGRLGFSTVEVHETAQSLYGYKGDERQQKAHVILRRRFVGSASNDIGFEFRDGTCIAHISEYDQGSMNYNEDWRSKVNTWYGYEKALSETKLKGYRFKEELDEKQRPRLRVFV